MTIDEVTTMIERVLRGETAYRRSHVRAAVESYAAERERAAVEAERREIADEGAVKATEDEENHCGWCNNCGAGALREFVGRIRARGREVTP